MKNKKGQFQFALIGIGAIVLGVAWLFKQAKQDTSFLNIPIYGWIAIILVLLIILRGRR